MLYLKQSTASQSVLIGPFVDSTDGATAETGLTIANTDIRLSANGGNLAAKNSGGGTHDEAGWYSITLDATDTATVGRLQLHCKMSGALMVHHEYQVLEETVYDALIGASAAGELAVKLSAQGKLDVNAEADTALSDYDPPTKAELDSGFAALNDPTAAVIADAVLDEALSGHTTAGSLGKAVADIETDAAAILADTGTDGVVVAAASKTGYSLTATTGLGNQTANITGNLSGSVGSVTGAVGSVTGNVGGNVVGSVGSLATQAKADVNAEVDIALNTAIPGTPTAGSINDVLADVDARLPGSGTISTLDAAAVNAEVVDALNTDTYAEPSSVPAATASLTDKIGWVAALHRNKITQTSTTQTLRNDADSGSIATSTVSDDGTTATRGEFS